MDKAIQDRLKDLSPEKRKAIDESSMLRKVVQSLKTCRERSCDKTVYKKQFCSPQCEAKYRHKPIPEVKESEKVDVNSEDIYAPLKDHYCFETAEGFIVSKNNEPVLFPKSEKDKMEKEISSGDQIGWSIIRADKAIKRLVLSNMPVPTEEDEKEMKEKEKPLEIKLDLSKIK